MGLIEKTLSRFGYSKKRIYKRNYDGAKSNNLTTDWLASNQAADELLKWQLPKLRERSRDLARNNDYAKEFFRMLKTNVVGPGGIKLQSKVKNSSGILDKAVNKLLEDEFKKWGKKATASVCQELSWWAIQNLTIETIARDGEIFIRKVKGYNNPYKFSLQLLEPDHVDLTLNKNLSNGNTIQMGIERNGWGKPVAYWVDTTHPGNATYYLDQKNRQRVPASEIVHIYLKERPSQTRGVPWLHTAILRLRMAGAYEEASLVAARIGASKMGFFSSDIPEGYTGEELDLNGDINIDVEPGSFERLPPNTTFQTFDPGQPTGDFAPFMKAVLRGVSAGIGVSYHNLTNDLESVNYNSLRQGALKERDVYRIIQRFLYEGLHDGIYLDFLEMSVLTGHIIVKKFDVDRLNYPIWQPRGWDWVDPLKEVNAQVKAVESKFKSRSQILGAQGEDFEELVEQLAYENELLEQYKLIESNDSNQKNQN